MKKRVFLFVIMFLLMGFFVCTLSTSKVNALLALNGDVDLLICNPGEDASTQMRFSFHTNVSGVTVQVAKKSDGNFDNAIKATPECVSFDEAYPFKGTSWGMDGGPGYDSKTMQICEAEVNNLEPDTEYMYRVGATNFSETRYFKTAGSDGTWGFLVMADPQTYVDDSLVGGINDNMNRAMENAKKLGFTPELVVCAGDQVNDGGKMGYWRGLYGLVDIYKQMPLACVVGNHGCLDAASGKVTSGMYVTASMWNAPRNGPEGNFIEDVYWFKWNNVLFVMMDSEAGGDSRMNPQTEWFKEVASTIDYQYMVVMYHQGQWGTTTPSPNRWYSTFEEYCIDLSFSGDNHDYGRGYKDYIGTPTVEKFGPFRGQANYPGHYVVVDDTRNASNSEANKGGYCIVKVTPSCLYYYAYDQYDIIRDQYVFTCQRPLTKDETFSKSEFENSIKVEVDEKNAKQAILSWENESYIGNVGYMTILDEAGKEVAKYFPNSTKIKTYTFGGLTANTDYNYKLKIEYKDGTDNTIDIKFRTAINYGTYSKLELKELSANYRLTFNPDEIKTNLLSKCFVYINGEKKAEYEPTAKFVSLDKSLINDDVVIELRGLISSNNTEVVIGTYSKNAPVVPKLTIDTQSLTITEGESKNISATVTENAKLVYSSSDESVAKVDQNGKVTAVKAGTAKIKVKVDGFDVEGEVSVTVEAKPVTPATPKLTVETKTLGLGEGDTGEIKATVTENAKLEFSSSDESVAKVDQNGKVTAVKAGTAQIKIKVSGYDIEETVTVKVEKKEPTPTDPTTPTDPEPTDPEPISPEPEPKKGCGAGAVQMVWTLVTTLGLVFIFRRRKF